jgi:hypothetical protein
MGHKQNRINCGGRSNAMQLDCNFLRAELIKTRGK